MLSDEILENSPRRPSRRRLWWTLGILAALFIAWAAVSVYSDAEPPDVSDLTLVPVRVADAENFYLALVKRGEAIKAAPIIREDEPEEVAAAVETATEAVGEEPAGAESTGPEKRLRERLLEGETWTPAQLTRWLPAFDALNAECREIAKLEKAQATIPRTLADIAPTSPGDARELMQQLRLTVWARYHAGRQADALASAWLGLDTGRRLADGRGGLIDYLTALAIKGMYYATLHDIAARNDVERDVLNAILAGLVARPTGTDAYAYSLRNEAQSGMQTLYSFTASEVAKHGSFTGASFDPPIVFAKTRILYPLVYKPNLTVALYAEYMREHIRIHDLPLKERMSRSPVFEEMSSGGGMLLRPYNLLGRTYLAIIVPTLGQVATTRHLSFSRQSALQAFVALRLYHLKHGILPATLDELVPAYLPSVPVDYVDRQPIRYSRDARVVWSAGKENLQVIATDQKISEREVFYRLDFAAPPALPGETTVSPSTDPDTPILSP